MIKNIYINKNMTDIVHKLISAIQNLLVFSKIINIPPPSTEKMFSNYIEQIRIILNSKEWKQLENILDEIFSGKWNNWFSEQEKELMSNPLIRDLVIRFVKVSKSKEFLAYVNRKKYRQCLRKSISKYDKKIVKKILTCYDIEFHKLIDVVDTKEWFEFSDYIYQNKIKIFILIKNF